MFLNLYANNYTLKSFFLKYLSVEHVIFKYIVKTQF